MLVVAAANVRPMPGKSWHRIIGWLALTSLLGHLVVVALFQPAFWRWLTPAIPLEIVSGLIAATAFGAALAAQRSARVRRKLGRIYSQHIHLIASYTLAIAATAHITLIADTSAMAGLIVFCGLFLLLADGILRERHTVTLPVTLGLFVVLLAGLANGPLAASRLAALRQAPIDHARFLHTDHTAFACTSCHHNFVDRSGNENCLTCHKRVSMSELTRIDRVLHAFCVDCHRMDESTNRKLGPIDDCNGCHR